jgi:hypothetical protein
MKGDAVADAKRVGHQYAALAAVVAGQHHEMSAGRAADVVGPIVRPEFARGAVKVGRREAGQDGQSALQDAADQCPRQADEAQPPAARKELQVALGGMLQPVILLDFALAAQPIGNVDVTREPGRVEDVEIVGVDGRLLALAQGVAGQEHGKGAAPVLELLRAGDDRVQRLLAAPVAIEGMQTGWAAGGRPAAAACSPPA